MGFNYYVPFIFKELQIVYENEMIIMMICRGKSLIRDKMEILNAFPLAVIVDCLMECYAHKIHTYKDKAGKVLQKMGSLLNAWTDQKIHGESVRYILAVRHEEKTLLTFLQEISLFDSIWYCYTKSVSEWESLWKLFRDTWFIFHLGT